MKKKLIAYLGSGIRCFTEQDAKMLTHVNIVFGGLNNDGTIDANHPINEKMELIRSWNPEIKFVLSLVQRQSDSFTAVCASKEKMDIMGEECVRVCKEVGYDGIDLDWEYPCVPSNGQDTCPEDKYRFTELLRTLRRHLDATGTHYILSIASGADVYYAENTELEQISKELDYINVMTYDLKCGFHCLAGHHTNLYSSSGDYFRNSCDQALRLFHSYGVPKEKLLLGAATYTRCWTDLQDRNHGYLQISKKPGGCGPACFQLTPEYLKENGYVRYWDDEAKAPWLFNGNTFISYDDTESMRYKAQYVVDNGYGGVFYWEHNEAKELIETLYEGLK